MEVEERSTALRLLRGLGAVTLLGATGSLLLSEWDLLTGIPLYLQLLATTVGLWLAGLGCTLLLKEAKGARTFLAITLLSVPINFAALGGLLYTEASAGALGGSIVTIALSTLLLLPIAWTSLRTLARARATVMTIALAAASSFLIVPVRDVTFTIVALGLGFAVVSIYEHFWLRHAEAVLTTEGRVARAALFLPFVLLAARTYIYYNQGTGFALTICAGLAWALSCLAYRLRTPAIRGVLQWSAVLPAAAASMMIPSVIGLGLPWNIMVGLLPLAIVLLTMGFFAGVGAPWFSGASAVVALTAGALTLCVGDGVGVVAVSFAVGIAVLAAGYGTRQVLSFLGGSLLSLAALATQLVTVIDLGVLPGWILFGVLGACAIVVASVLERHGPRFLVLVGRLRSRFQEG